ncbi:MAG: hypothetical protein LBJ15_14515 [Comamonas sp.]|uniref:hypothetical protein n=1 Tax=Comamonas sp. TaxID=34028 RepID=UPI002823CFAB|nr:hypothetical protein [Comamonas sp.]MDR0215206.1 hypothetical protein [Comamonas sp.]
MTIKRYSLFWLKSPRQINLETAAQESKSPETSDRSFGLSGWRLELAYHSQAIKNRSCLRLSSMSFQAI